jgi:hypothetical protein
MDETRPERTYSVLETLENIKTAVTELSRAMAANRAALERYTEKGKTEKARDCHDILRIGLKNLTDAVNRSRLCLFETGEDALAGYAGKLASRLAAFNLMTKDYGPLSAALENFAAKLPEHKTVNAACLGRLMNSVRMGHYPTDPGNLSHIMNAIAFPPGVVTNLLDPCCGNGAALKQIAVGNNCITYGIELDEGRAEAAQNELHRVGFGSFFHSRISRDAFHLIFLNPPYLSVLTEGVGRTRDEKRFLIESLPHLVRGGLLIYIIPYYRLTPDICRILADNLDDISLHRFTEKEFKRFGQVAAMGTRRERTDGSAKAGALSELAYAAGNLPTVTELGEGRYSLPAEARKAETFRGAVFNERELARQLRNAKGFESPAGAKPLSGKTGNPPLPFTVGQIGLIGGSGLINGLIECDTPHIVKGRIVKETHSVPRHAVFNTNDKLICA